MNFNKTFYIAFFLLPVVFGSCEKEIQLDLDTGLSTLVIDAEISAHSPVNTIKLSKTGLISQADELPLVSGANITLTDQDGYFEKLNESSPGCYQTQNFNGVVGKTYYLTVTSENRTYTANSTLQPLVKLDTVILKKLNLGAKSLTGILPVFQDVLGQNNYYRFISHINQIRVKGSVVNSDEYNDGSVNSMPFFNSELIPQEGDTVWLEMQNISRQTYLYYTGIRIVTNQNSSAPANPVSNIEGGALGHFSVHHSQTKWCIYTNP